MSKVNKKNNFRTKPLILLIEDEGLLNRMYAQKLELEGFEVLLAENGNEGMEMAKNHLPDLILLDVMMPEKDGLTMLAEFEHKETEKLKVIIMSNVDNETYQERAFELGAISYIVKGEKLPSEIVKEIRQKLKAMGKDSLVV